MENKGLSDEEFNFELERRLKEKELEDQREEALKEIEDKPIRKRGKFLTFLAQLLGLAPQIIGVLKDTNVLKDKSKK